MKQVVSSTGGSARGREMRNLVPSENTGISCSVYVRQDLTDHTHSAHWLTERNTLQHHSRCACSTHSATPQTEQTEPAPGLS